MASYETPRAAISEGRFRFPHDVETLDDMLMLQADYEKRRVDHLPRRKKGVSDALAAGKVEGAGIAAVQPALAATVTPTFAYAGHESYMEMVRHERGIGYL
jgi:hypothetical protein